MNTWTSDAVTRPARQLPYAPDLGSEYDWRDDAACREYAAELFFPVKGNTADSRAAREVCASCPVKDECLAWALEHGERYGVWGGLSETERRKLASAQGIRRGTGRAERRPRTHLCQVKGCGYAGPTRDALSSHRVRKHRAAGAA